MSGESEAFVHMFKQMKAAHGLIMGIAFVVLMPVAAILIRVTTWRYIIWVHAAIMLTAYAMSIAGLGLGAWMAHYGKLWLGPVDQGGVQYNGHPIIGIIIVAFFLTQPVTGLLHWRRKRQTGERGASSVTHRWIGRVFLILALINGGLGVWLGKTQQSPALTRRIEIAYAVPAAVFGTAWLIVALVWEGKREEQAAAKREGRLMSKSESGAGGSTASPEGDAEDKEMKV